MSTTNYKQELEKQLIETMYKKLLEEKDKQIAALTEQIKHLHEKLFEQIKP